MDGHQTKSGLAPKTVCTSSEMFLVLACVCSQFHFTFHYLKFGSMFFTQLRKTTFVKDSTMIICLNGSPPPRMSLCQCMMPRDVTTCWNSTYDMLVFALEYRDALDPLTGNQRMKLRRYELMEEDWNIATKLHDILKVRHYSLLAV